MNAIPQQYVRKPFYVNAIQVTSENMEEVADWCNGTVFTSSNSSDFYIKVPVLRPISDRQTSARVGDWILSSPKGFKVYTDTAFQKGFEKEDAPEQVTNEELELLLKRIETKLDI